MREVGKGLGLVVRVDEDRWRVAYGVVRDEEGRRMMVKDGGGGGG